MATTDTKMPSIIDESLAKRGTKHVVEGAVGFAMCLALSFPAKLLLFSVIIFELVAAGLVLVLARWLFFFILPALIAFAAPLTILVEFFELIIVTFIDAAISVVDAIIAIADFFSGKPTNNMVHFVGFKLFTVAEVKDELIFIMENCKHDTDAYTVIGNTVRRAAQLPVCSAVRFVYPSEWLYTATNGLLGWLFVGSADPSNAMADVGTDANCEYVPTTGYIPAVCASFGAGYVILEIVLPFFLAVLLHSAVGVMFWTMMLGLLELGWTAVKAGVGLLDRLFLRFLL